MFFGFLRAGPEVGALVSFQFQSQIESGSILCWRYQTFINFFISLNKYAQVGFSASVGQHEISMILRIQLGNNPLGRLRFLQDDDHSLQKRHGRPAQPGADQNSKFEF